MKYAFLKSPSGDKYSVDDLMLRYPEKRYGTVIIGQEKYWVECRMPGLQASCIYFKPKNTDVPDDLLAVCSPSHYKLIVGSEFLTEEQLDFILSSYDVEFYNSSKKHAEVAKIISQPGINRYFEITAHGATLTSNDLILSKEFCKFCRSKNLILDDFPLLKSLIVTPQFIA